VFAQATGDLRCRVGSRVDAADAKPTPSPCSAMPVELATATVSDLPQPACRKPIPGFLRTLG
jgi:hypothetical protein